MKFDVGPRRGCAASRWRSRCSATLAFAASETALIVPSTPSVAVTGAATGTVQNDRMQATVRVEAENASAAAAASEVNARMAKALARAKSVAGRRREERRLQHVADVGEGQAVEVEGRAVAAAHQHRFRRAGRAGFATAGRRRAAGLRDELLGRRPKRGARPRTR